MVPAATVYLVTNAVNGHEYVGVTRKQVSARWVQHVYMAKYSPTTRLRRAIAKYGAEKFAVVAVASCLTEEYAGAVERAVIQSRAPIYNQTNGGEITTGRRIPRDVVEKIAAKNAGLKRTPEQNVANSVQAKLRWANAEPEWKQARLAVLRRSRETIDESKRLAALAESRKSYIWSAESRAKLSASCMGRRYGRDIIDRMAATKRKLVECITLHTVFDSVSDAAKLTGVDIAGISKVCRGTRKTAGGMLFQFV